MKKATIMIMLLAAAYAPLAIADDDLTIRINDIFSEETEAPSRAEAAFADIMFVGGEILLARTSAAPEDGPVHLSPTDDGEGVSVGLDGGRLATNVRGGGVIKGTKTFAGEVADFFRNNWGKMLTVGALRVAYHNRSHLGVGGDNDGQARATTTTTATATDTSHDCLSLDHTTIVIGDGATFAPNADCHDSSSGP